MILTVLLISKMHLFQLFNERYDVDIQETGNRDNHKKEVYSNSHARCLDT